MSDNKECKFINWPVATVIIVGLIALTFICWVDSLDDEAELAAQVENNKNRIEYDKWLLEKGFIKEPRIR